MAVSSEWYKGGTKILMDPVKMTKQARCIILKMTKCIEKIC